MKGPHSLDKDKVRKTEIEKAKKQKSALSKNESK